MTKLKKYSKSAGFYKAHPRDFFDSSLGMPGKLRGFYRMMIDLFHMHDGVMIKDFRYISGQTGYGKVQCQRMIRELVDMGKIQTYRGNYQLATQDFTSQIPSKAKKNGGQK